MRTVLHHRETVPVVEVEDALDDHRLIDAAPPVLGRVQVVLEQRRRLAAKQLEVHVRIHEQVPVDGDVLDAADTDGVRRRLAGGGAARRVGRTSVSLHDVAFDVRLDPLRERRVAVHVELDHVAAGVFHELVVGQLEVLGGAGDRRAADAAAVAREAVERNRRVAVETVDAELEVVVVGKRRITDVDAVVVHFSVHQVHLEPKR